MKINMASLEDGIVALGFRKMAAFMERVNPDTNIFYVGTPRYRSIMKSLHRSLGSKPPFGPDQIDEIAQGLAKDADIVALSSMSGYSDLTKSVINRVREINKNAYVIWGGIHPIIYPEDAIAANVDAICTGEGELPFGEFLHHFQNGGDFTNVQNFWFKSKNGEIKRNPFRPLLKPAELETLPFAKYGGKEWMYRPENGFTPVTINDYLANNGLGYSAIWSIGCPLHCTFCGNTVFIANDPMYAKIRHTSSEYIIGEVEHARSVHPHLSTVLFYDDSFLAIPLRELTDFATKWRERVGLPFVIFGVIPTYVVRDKMEVLTWAGLQRVRMGVQSGSDRILKFYKRPTPVPKVESAAKIISEFKKFQINPAYDLIVDNPIETRQDVVDTLELIYRLARPFTLNIFSLRIIPNTVLEKQMKENGIDLEQINANYMSLRPTFGNVLLFLLMWYRPPRWLFDMLLKKVRAYGEDQPAYPMTLFLARLPWLMLQASRHLRWGEFSVITGKSGYILWKTGILPIWWKLFRPKYQMPVAVDPSGGAPPATSPA